jgi:hypothetical protein
MLKVHPESEISSLGLVIKLKGGSHGFKFPYQSTFNDNARSLIRRCLIFQFGIDALPALALSLTRNATKIPHSKNLQLQ